MTDYVKIVSWPSPINGEPMIFGLYGLTYTNIDLEVPLIDKSREIWNTSKLFLGNPSIQSSSIRVTLYTSMPYQRGTLIVYANGIAIESKEVTNSDRFSCTIGDIRGTYLYITYVPLLPKRYLGNRVEEYETLYGVKCSLKYSPYLRKTISLARIYINQMKTALKLPGDLWFGGPDNSEIANIQPVITQTDKVKHIESLHKAVKTITEAVIGLGYNKIALISSEYNFSVPYIEGLQRTISDLDTGLAYLSSKGIL